MAWRRTTREGIPEMLEDVLIAPSILSADLGHLADELGSIGSADLIHVDVMDGHFVPNLTWGPPVVAAARAVSDLPCDVHLMVTNPDETVGLYLDAGAAYVSFHAEAARHAHRIVSQIHEAGAKAGIALNPGTPVSALDCLIDDLDYVLLMSVNPGFGGQSFIPGTLRKLRQLRQLCAERGVSPLVEVDGGVSAKNAEEIAAAGANLLVAGSAVFGRDDRAQAIDEIRAAGRRGVSRRA